MLLASRDVGEGLRQTDLVRPGIHCGGCVQRIERARAACRASNRRASISRPSASTIRWRRRAPPPFIATLRGIGYEAHLHDAGADDKDATLSRTGPGACRRRLCGQQHHAAVGLGLVRRGACDPRPVPLDLGADRASRAGLFGPRLLPVGLAQLCGTARPIWTCRSPSACCSPSA